MQPKSLPITKEGSMPVVDQHYWAKQSMCSIHNMHMFNSHAKITCPSICSRKFLFYVCLDFYFKSSSLARARLENKAFSSMPRFGYFENR